MTPRSALAYGLGRTNRNSFRACSLACAGGSRSFEVLEEVVGGQAHPHAGVGWTPASRIRCVELSQLAVCVAPPLPAMPPEARQHDTRPIRSWRREGLHDWFFGEHVTWNDAFSPVHFTQLIFAGEDTSATTTTYATVTWRGAFAGVPASGKTHKIRICDFYQVRTRPSYVTVTRPFQDPLHL